MTSLPSGGHPLIASIDKLQAVLDVRIVILAAVGEDDGVTRWLD